MQAPYIYIISNIRNTLYNTAPAQIETGLSAKLKLVPRRRLGAAERQCDARHRLARLDTDSYSLETCGYSPDTSGGRLGAKGGSLGATVAASRV